MVVLFAISTELSLCSETGKEVEPLGYNGFGKAIAHVVKDTRKSSANGVLNGSNGIDTKTGISSNTLSNEGLDVGTVLHGQGLLLIDGDGVQSSD